MHIRKAAIDDCVQLTELRIAMRIERENRSVENLPSFQKDTLCYFTEHMADDSFVAFIAEENEKIISTSGILFYQVPPTLDNRSGRVAYIMNMYTQPEYRRQGLAGHLLRCLVKEAQERLCGKLTLNASPMGKPLYQQFGFTEVENEMTYSLDYCDYHRNIL